MNVVQQGTSTLMEITAGETVALGITIANGTTPINVTSYTFKMRINTTPTPIDLNTTNGGITITNGAAGMVQINMTSAATAAIPTGVQYPYDFWMIQQNGAETPLFQGVFVVTPNISPVP